MSKKFNLILFDCDGTLVDSEYLNLKAIVAYLNEQGITQYKGIEDFERFSGFRFSAILEMISAETGHTFPETPSRRYLEIVRSLAQTELTPIKGALELVRTAKNTAQIGVVSNGERNNVLYSLTRVGLKDFFVEDDIFTGLMAKNPKPAPDLYLNAAAHFNVTGQETLVIEDSTVGVRAAKAAGMTCWGFTGTHHNQTAQSEALLAAGADRVFSDCAAITDGLKQQ